MASNQNGIFVPGMPMPRNCFSCPFMRERIEGIECIIDHAVLKYPDPRVKFDRPVGCPLKTVTSGIVDNMLRKQNHMKGEN